MGASSGLLVDHYTKNWREWTLDHVGAPVHESACAGSTIPGLTTWKQLELTVLHGRKWTNYFTFLRHRDRLAHLISISCNSPRTIKLESSILAGRWVFAVDPLATEFCTGFPAGRIQRKIIPGNFEKRQVLQTKMLVRAVFDQSKVSCVIPFFALCC
jgi:hypothetical protein